MTQLALTNAINARWASLWTYSNTAYDNKPFTPVSGTAWARIAIREAAARQASLGRPSYDRHTGVVFVQIFVPLSQGDSRSRWLVDKAVEIFRKVDVPTALGTVTFGNPYVSSIEQGGDDWWQSNVTCPYLYDELS